MSPVSVAIGDKALQGSGEGCRCLGKTVHLLDSRSTDKGWNLTEYYVRGDIAISNLIELKDEL